MVMINITYIMKSFKVKLYLLFIYIIIINVNIKYNKFNVVATELKYALKNTLDRV